MPKKIFLTIFVLLVIGVGVFLAYKNGIFQPKPQAAEWEKLLVFQIKMDNISSETAQSYQKKFEETKTKIKSNPDDFNSWLYLGLIKKVVNDYEGARDVWVYAGKIRPKSSTPFANLGELYGYYLNQPQEAEKAYKTAIENDPNEVNYRLALADTYRYKFPDGNAKYEQTILEALNKFTDDVNLASALASFYKQTGQRDKAISAYERLIKLAPNNQAAKDDLTELKNQPELKI